MRTVVYAHASKTAGSSIHRALLTSTPRLDVRYIGHSPFGTVESDELPVISVRNPYTRVFSQYHYFLPKKRIPDTSFEEFVLNYPPPPMRANEMQPALFSSAFDQLAGQGRAHIIRFESLQEDMNVLGRMLEVQLGLPHKNRSQDRKFKMDVYTSRMRARINEYFAADFKVFGYTMKD
jgi:hypothetical protein